MTIHIDQSMYDDLDARADEVQSSAIAQAPDDLVRWAIRRHEAGGVSWPQLAQIISDKNVLGRPITRRVLSRMVANLEARGE